jgi:hypothetical protein
MPEYPDISAIGAGHNVALVDLDLITSILGTDQLFLPVRTPGKHRRGEKRVRANGIPDRSGFASKEFTSGLMTVAQFEYLIATYEGPVTLYSWLTTTTAVRYNAILDMGEQADYAEDNTVEWGWCLRDVVWKLTKIQVIP